MSAIHNPADFLAGIAKRTLGVTAHGIQHSTEQFRAGGNHRTADNDEPEPDGTVATRQWPMPAQRGTHRIADKSESEKQSFYRAADRAREQRKDSGADRAEQYERALAEQMQRAEILR